jgi:hypothetical protein
MGADVLRHRVDIAERALQRAGCVQRTSTAGDIHQINRLHRAVDSVRGSQPHERPRFQRHFTGRQKVGPKLMEAIEQKKPGRPDQRLGLSSRFLAVIGGVWLSIDPLGEK